MKQYLLTLAFLILVGSVKAQIKIGDTARAILVVTDTTARVRSNMSSPNDTRIFGSFEDWGHGKLSPAAYILFPPGGGQHEAYPIFAIKGYVYLKETSISTEDEIYLDDHKRPLNGLVVLDAVIVDKRR